VTASASSSTTGSGKPARTNPAASGRAKKRFVGARRRSGVDSRKPASFSRAISAATEDFDLRPSRAPIDAYDGIARWRA
jgi:hypothetical protein